jgi:ABC-type transport system substrate-binding protein
MEISFRMPRLERSALSAARRVTPLVLAFAFLLTACSQIQRPTAEPFYAQTPPPPRQEFRWSNGKMPKSFDPARAAAAPETDIIRAVYEGLTDLDAKSLKAIPGVAEKWESSPDLKIWTFHLRKDSRWSNGEQVTADDFVQSWQRLANMRERAANNYLFQNIVGMKMPVPALELHNGEPIDFLHETPADSHSPTQKYQSEANSAAKVQTPPHTRPSPMLNPARRRKSRSRRNSAARPLTTARYE